jgi:hypothetical protein
VLAFVLQLAFLVPVVALTVSFLVLSLIPGALVALALLLVGLAPILLVGLVILLTSQVEVPGDHVPAPRS